MTAAPTRRPTMAEVATQAGVSRMTVSYAYSQPDRVGAETARRVHEAAARLGYPGPHPGARSLRQGRAGVLGVVIGEHLTYAFDDPQAARFLAGVAQVCAEESVGLLLVPATGTADDARRVTGAAVDGFVVWTTTADDPVLAAVVATGLPAVVHAGPPGAGVASVGIDDRAAARALGRVVLAGARRPAVLSFPLDRARQEQRVRGLDPSPVAFPVTRDRLLGFRDAWTERGGDWADVTVVVCGRNAQELGRARTGPLLSDGDHPDVVLAMSDELALGAVAAARDAGLRVPGDLAVSGWDDSAAAGAAGLTTVRQDLRAQGAGCARRALGLPAGEAEPGWQVVLRTTTRGAAS